MDIDILYKAKAATNLGTFEFEGSKEFVEEQVQKIMEQAKSSPITDPHTSIEPNHDQPKTSGKNTPQRKVSIESPQMLPDLITDREKLEGLRGFYKSKAPANQMEIFAVLAHWLKSNLGLTEVSIDEMWTLHKILSVKPPKVLVQVFRDGKSKKGYFEAGKATGKYYLTPFGETFVEHDLPRGDVSKTI